MTHETKAPEASKKQKKGRPNISDVKKWIAQKQMGLAMIFLGTLMLITLGVFLKFSVLQVQGLPELLPEHDTLLYIEFDLREKTEAPQKSLQNFLLSDTSGRFGEKIKVIVAEYFEKPEKSFLTGLGGFALLKSSIPAASGVTIPMLLLQVKNPQQCNNFLAGLPPEEQSKYRLIEDFLVVSPSPEGYERILETIASEEAFATNAAFLNASKSLPVSQFASFAVNASEFDNPLTKPFQLFAGKWLKPVENAKSASILHISGLLRERRMILPERRYHADLLKYFPSDAELFAGGENLASRIHFFDRNFTFISDILEAYGASEVPPERHLYPLFENEYGFALLPRGGFLLLTKVEPQHAASIEILKQKLPFVLSIMMPAVREVTLPDETKGRELYASADLISTSDEKIGSDLVRVYKAKHKSFELLIVEKNGLLLVTNDRTLASQVLSGNISHNLRSSAFYRTKVREVLRGVNELIIAKKQWWKKSLPSSATALAKLKAFLSPYPEIALSVRYNSETVEIFASF